MLCMLLDVVQVKTTPDFQLELGFQNGERRRFDMRPLLACVRGIALRRSNFSTVHRLLTEP